MLLTPALWALTVALSVTMGFTLGLLGGGGSILSVPILLYVVGLPPKEAIATSLIVVAATAAFSTALHHRRGNVRWRTGLVFAPFAMIGAYGGGRAAGLIPGQALILLFAGMMVLAGASMIRGRKGIEPGPPATLPRSAAQGLGVGAFTGLVGAGGGFLFVPTLVLLGGLQIRAAVGTSVLIISLNCVAGFVGHMSHVSPDLKIAGLVAGCAVVGAFAGTRAGQGMDPRRLKRAFGVFVLVMAAVIVFKELGPT